MIWLLIVIVAALIGGAYLTSLWVHPWVPCRACKGSGRSRDPLWRSAYGTCRACGGRGRHARLGVRLLQPGRAKRLAGTETDHKTIDKRRS